MIDPRVIEVEELESEVRFLVSSWIPYGKPEVLTETVNFP
jgi:hypothetical protein